MTYEELKSIVQKHCILYYDLSAPEISDKEFDKLYDSLEAMEKAQGWVAYDSPTVKVGSSAGKVSHPVKLYSLKKVYNKEEVDPSFDVETPKIDGANLTLVYKYGRLALAITRGNGDFGDSVTHLALKITNIPTTISRNYKLLVVNGECVTINKVENFRNYVSGALGLKSPEEFATRGIQFIAHDLLTLELNYVNRMQVLQNLGFTTVLDNNLVDYPTDGIVYRINDYNKCKELGYTSKYPRFAVALKEREVNTVTTVLQDVLWSIGRTGAITPTGVITPVEIDDAIISKVTLHNIGIIEDTKLGIGDLISIERAGGVIPKFIKVIEHSKHNLPITTAHAEKQLGVKSKRVGPKLYILNKNDTNNHKIVEHFVKTMEIKGLGPANIKKLDLTHISDIYSTEVDWSILGAVAIKIQDEIEKSKTKPYDQVLAAFGIPNVGRTASKLIVANIPKFEHLKDIPYSTIKGIGPVIVSSILEWLDENEDWVYELPIQLEQKIQLENILVTHKRKVCITGKMDMTRSQLQEILENKGYVVTTTVSKDTYALIADGEESSSKYKKAKELGITIVNYWTNRMMVLSGDF